MRPLLTAAFLTGLVATPVFAQSIELAVVDAQPFFDEASQEGSVFVQLDRESARAFAKFTRDNLRKQIRILVDGKVNATPTIMEPIFAGFPIQGLASDEAASALAARLKTGQSMITAAPAP